MIVWDLGTNRHADCRPYGRTRPLWVDPIISGYTGSVEFFMMWGRVSCSFEIVRAGSCWLS